MFECEIFPKSVEGFKYIPGDHSPSQYTPIIVTVIRTVFWGYNLQNFWESLSKNRWNFEDTAIEALKDEIENKDILCNVWHKLPINMVKIKVKAEQIMFISKRLIECENIDDF